MKRRRVFVFTVPKDAPDYELDDRLHEALEIAYAEGEANMREITGKGGKILERVVVVLAVLAAVLLGI